jgi:tetratricopeptide (TPR) repeat protein
MAVIAAALLVVLWFFVVKPADEVDAVRAEQTLASGIALFEQEQYESAIEALQGVPVETPQAARALYYEGSAHMMLKDYESAAPVLERSLALSPSDAGTLYALGVAYFKLGNLALSKSYFAKVLEINPNDEHAKGLMDIMSGLERQSVAAPAPESEEETDN